ncbi:hypothetical protein EB796_015149 [Bugula neritina]|uniref:PPM-type phosphatase domain-containing protein n=1 Tax=Bugula neritina TaxID=10212 RepID=A0A7J7JJL8_BUGNE|nr:hypothetical protein EB796_015149 [Bugula neritina]
MEDRFTFVNKLDQSSSSSKISLYGIFDGHGGELSVEYVEKALFKKVMTSCWMVPSNTYRKMTAYHEKKPLSR